MQSSSDSTSTIATTRHVPVLLQEVLEVLNIQENDIVLDGTLGGGGHARALASLLSGNGQFIGFDVDAEAIDRARAQLLSAKSPVTLIHDNFRNVSAQLQEYGFSKVDKAFFDLGWSSDQLEVSHRGFSFERNEPLRMTLSSETTEDVLTAYDIVNSWQEESLADVIYGWGGERFARRIARGIVQARADRPLETTFDLVEVIRKSVPAPYRRGKRNPATKTFQALRIAVNDELGALQETLEALPYISHEGTTVAFLTFHSLEDKVVKETFRTWAKKGMGEIVTKKPIAPSATEVGQNPRSRSAKLRGFKFTHYENDTVSNI